MADNRNTSYVVIANLLVAVGVFAFVYVGQQMSHPKIADVANAAPKVTAISTAMAARPAP